MHRFPIGVERHQELRFASTQRHCLGVKDLFKATQRMRFVPSRFLYVGVIDQDGHKLLHCLSAKVADGR